MTAGHSSNTESMTIPTDAHAPFAGQNLAAAVSLSVLTPVYNERHLVAASLARVLALSSPYISRLEIIVVDDRSIDGSWGVLQQVAARDPRIQLYRHERAVGKERDSHGAGA